ncbi:MAG: phosphoribosyltransferase [Patescibacteria group bacterium]|nr:phosphoribosyltransferase [Patescibacteria group bacterium]
MDDVLAILKEAGAIVEGHFIGISGRHLSVYVNKDAWLPRTDLVSKVCRMIAESNAENGIEAVVGPAVGGIPLSQWTAHHLSQLTGKTVLSLFTEKTQDDGQAFSSRRGYDKLVKGKRVLAVEDTVTTGGSVMKSLNAIREAGGELIHLTIIVNRDPAHINSELFGVAMNALAELPSESYAEEELPEWLKQIPVNTVLGHGAKYMKEHSQP